MNLHLSMRNLRNVGRTQMVDINTYDIMNADVLVLTEDAARLLSAAGEEAAAA
jgi:large subunit ribosomal protein L4